MTAATWVPTKALLDETRAIVTQLARRWPKRLGYLLELNEAAREDLAAFAYALRDIDARVRRVVAREYMLGNEWAPGPHELRVEALRIEARDFPKPPAEPVPPPPIQTGHDHDRIAEITRVFRAELGTMRDVVEAWEMLGRAVVHDPKQFAEVRAGKATPEQVAAAIVAVRNLRAKEAAAERARAEREASEDAA